MWVVSFEIGSRIYPPKLLLMRDMRSNLVQKEELRISDGVESLFIENQEKTKKAWRTEKTERCQRSDCWKNL